MLEIDKVMDILLTEIRKTIDFEISKRLGAISDNADKITDAIQFNKMAVQKTMEDLIVETKKNLTDDFNSRLSAMEADVKKIQSEPRVVVEMPTSPAPIVNIPAPIVNIEAAKATVVNVEAAKAPVVNVAAPVVNVAPEMKMASHMETTTINRDQTGKIISTTKEISSY